jgi:hypothetical protein
MRDIIITLPATIAWADYEKELANVRDNGDILNFKIPSVPKEAKPGARCYLVHKGFIRGWMTITHIGKRSAFTCQTTGIPFKAGIYVQRAGMFHPLQTPVPHKGFQGFRYFEPSQVLGDQQPRAPHPTIEQRPDKSWAVSTPGVPHMQVFPAFGADSASLERAVASWSNQIPG